MSIEKRKTIITLGHLYKVERDPSEPMQSWMLNPHIWINSGTVDIYSSDTEGKPAALTEMTLNEDCTGVSGNLGFGFIPLYIAITQASGTSTEIIINGAEFTDLGAIS